MLKVVASGDRKFLERYAVGLREDCDRFGYDYHQIELEEVENLSVINHKIFESHIKFIEENPSDRILLLDPECRIIKPIPQEWISETRPVIFFKVRDKNELEAISHANGIAMRIIAQPMFLSSKDLGWFTMALNMSKAMSSPSANLYARSEQFLEVSLNYNKVDYVRENCIFDRSSTLPHRSVRGNWQTGETVIQHPHIHGSFDDEVLKYPSRSKIITARVLESHTSDLNNVQKINQLFAEEEIDKWMEIDNWFIHPSTGRIKYKDYKNTVKFHHSVRDKMQSRTKSNALRYFMKYNSHRLTK